MKKKCLVTGATGFIGNYVVEELLKRNIYVIATSSNLLRAKQQSWFSKVEYFELDFEKLDNIINYFEYFNNPDILIHLAWEGLPNYKNEFHLSKNLPRHKLLLENFINNGLKTICALGTCFEYGLQEGELQEDIDCQPSNPYAIAKHSLNLWLQKLKEKQAFDLNWIRLFYIYGNGQSQSSLFAQLQNAIANQVEFFNMSKGDQQRDFLPVEKVAENIVSIALQNKVQGSINCCSGKPIKVIDFVNNYLVENNKVLKLNTGFYPYSELEPMNFWGNTNKLQLALSEN